MTRTGPRRIAAVAALALVAALTGCSSAADQPATDRPAPTGPTSAPPTVRPPVPPSASPTAAPSAPPSASVDGSVGGWDIHYREDGRLKVLKVEDFPR
jgi:glucose/arabinose dehydrogenase